MPWSALPKRIEYALKALVCLAQSHKEPVRAHELACCVRIPESQAAKTLYFLTWAGLVCSRRGPQGGFWLARAPDHIRVQQVMKAFHAPAIKGGRAEADPLMHLWGQIAAGPDEFWEKLTIADLLQHTAEDAAARPYVCPHTRQPVSASGQGLQAVESKGDQR